MVLLDKAIFCFGSQEHVLESKASHALLLYWLWTGVQLQIFVDMHKKLRCFANAPLDQHMRHVRRLKSLNVTCKP